MFYLVVVYLYGQGYFKSLLTSCFCFGLTAVWLALVHLGVCDIGKKKNYFFWDLFDNDNYTIFCRVLLCWYLTTVDSAVLSLNWFVPFMGIITF